LRRFWGVFELPLARWMRSSGVDRVLAALLRDDVRVRAREDLDGVAHLLGDLPQREALLGEAEAGMGVAEEVGRGVGPADARYGPPRPTPSAKSGAGRTTRPPPSSLLRR
jgi:hypothetical protein